MSKPDAKLLLATMTSKQKAELVREVANWQYFDEGGNVITADAWRDLNGQRQNPTALVGFNIHGRGASYWGKFPVDTESMRCQHCGTAPPSTDLALRATAGATRAVMSDLVHAARAAPGYVAGASVDIIVNGLTLTISADWRTNEESGEGGMTSADGVCVRRVA